MSRPDRSDRPTHNQRKPGQEPRGEAAAAADSERGNCKSASNTAMVAMTSAKRKCQDSRKFREGIRAVFESSTYTLRQLKVLMDTVVRAPSARPSYVLLHRAQSRRSRSPATVILTSEAPVNRRPDALMFMTLTGPFATPWTRGTGEVVLLD